MIYDYARVSTDHQNLAAQVERLTAEDCAKVYQATASGSRADRAALKRAGEGWERARKRGVLSGVKPKLTLH